MFVNHDHYLEQQKKNCATLLVNGHGQGLWVGAQLQKEQTLIRHRYVTLSN